MTTSIRAIRKQRGLTLQQLADKVGTTPQTIQRLETGNMSVSVDWLERIAIAFALTPADLLVSTGMREQRVPLIGHLVSGGNVHAVAISTDTAAGVAGGFADDGSGANPERPHVTISGPTEHCIALNVTARVGHYAEGTVLVARRQVPDAAIPPDCDCLVALDNGDMILSRVTHAANGSVTFTTYDTAADGIMRNRIAWIAPVYMVVRGI